MPRPLATIPLSDGILAVRDLFVNYFVVRGPGGLICVDAGWRPSRAARRFAALGLEVRDVVAVLLTHAHWDHAWGIPAFPEAGVFAAYAPAGSGRRPIADGQCFTLAGLEVQVLGCPGHTDDSMAFLIEGKHLFTGDGVWLDKGSPRPGHPWSNRDLGKACESLRRLGALKGVVGLYTAHSGVADAPFQGHP